MSTFVAMGCIVEIEGAAPHEASQIERLFHERDHRFSRFQERSELVHVNRACGEVVALTPGFAAMLQRALTAAASTSGLVDPTLGEASFSRARKRAPASAPSRPELRGREA